MPCHGPGTPELRLDYSNPMAAGCEGNSVPEDARCDPSLCGGLPDAVFVELVDVHGLSGALPGLENGSFAKDVGRRKFPTQQRPLMLLGEWCLPCRMPSLCQQLLDARATPRRRLPDAKKILAAV